MNTPIPPTNAPSHFSPSQLSSPTGTARDGTGKKILIVDDSVIIQKTLSAKLRAVGYQVFIAADGSAAVSAVRRERPDLILLDINFPPDVGHGGGVAWDGFLIMTWLRRMEEALTTPVVIITGSDPAAFKNRCVAAGVSGYFQKPLKHDELLSAIGKILAAKAEADTASNSASAKTVLFIDDENDWRFMASIYLKDSGFEVLVAGNGAEGLARMRDSRPDVVLLDLNLANESGLEVLRQLKEEFPATRVILYTGMEHDRQAIDAMLRLGAHQYLRKGTMGEMLQAVRNVVGHHPKEVPTLKLTLAG